MVPFGETVLLWRLERGLSQEKLAQRAGVSRPNLSAIERGKRDVTVKTLRALALALQIQPGVLADGRGPLDFKKKADSSRETLERIADGVFYGKPVGSEAEKEVVSLLTALTRNRASISRQERRPYLRRRSTSRAWLRLASGYSPEVVTSLLQRIADREHRDQARD